MDAFNHGTTGRTPVATFILGLLAGLLIATTATTATAGAVTDGAAATAADTISHDTRSLHHDVDVEALAHDTTSPYHASWAPLIHPPSQRPYRLIDTSMVIDVDAEVTQMFPVDAIVDGLHFVNDVPGSSIRVGVRVDGQTEGARWTVELDDCSGPMASKSGWARSHVAEVDEHGAWVDGGKIGLCRTTEGRSEHFVRALVSHELAHLLGFGHMCDTDECWQFDAHTDPCTFMSPSVHPCQPTDPIEGVLPLLYPSGDGVMVAPTGTDTPSVTSVHTTQPATTEDVPMGVRR